MTRFFHPIRASPMQLRCESFCIVRLFAHFCHRFAPQGPTSLPKKSFSFAAKGCIMLLNYAAFCFLRDFSVICQQILPLQFIPARGRKHELTVVERIDDEDCNLSPQGDEN